MSVRVAACQIDPEIGEVDRNLERIERSLIKAVRSGVELAVFPEAATTGYAYASLEEAEPVARRARAGAGGRSDLQRRPHPRLGWAPLPVQQDPPAVPGHRPIRDARPGRAAGLRAGGDAGRRPD